MGRLILLGLLVCAALLVGRVLGWKWPRSWQASCDKPPNEWTPFPRYVDPKRQPGERLSTLRSIANWRL